MREKIGIFGSNDEITEISCQKLKNFYEIVLFSFSPLKFKYGKKYLIEFGNIEKVFKIFDKEKIKKFLFIGKVETSQIFNSKFHLSGKKFLNSISNWNSEIILKTISDFLMRKNIEIIPLVKIFKEQIVEKKVYTKRQPTEREVNDIDIGFKILNDILKYRIGQSLTIKNGMVIAIEGIEGTDKMIERTGKFCKDFVFVKIAGRNKDIRFDLPVIGPDTIKNLYKAGGRVIAVEANKSIIINEEKIVNLANKYNITLLGNDYKR